MPWDLTLPRLPHIYSEFLTAVPYSNTVTDEHIDWVFGGNGEDVIMPLILPVMKKRQ